MPNMNWSKLSSMQLGRYAEYYAKMELTSYGYDVYTSEVDDHGVDFIAKTPRRQYLEIQVKAIRESKYIFMQETKWDIKNPNLYLFLLIFEEEKLPRTYLIGAKEWQNSNALLKYKRYDNLKSNPEYGLNISRRNLVLLEKYRLDNDTYDPLLNNF